MKHLIIFFNYDRSRLDNPVYRRFALSSHFHHEVILLFLPGRLDERELLRQVRELRTHSQEQCPITFHLCMQLTGNSDGETVVDAVRIIRKMTLHEGDTAGQFPLYIYARMPAPDSLRPKQKQTVWKNLTVLNRECVNYRDTTWIDCIYLYNDPTQLALSNFLYTLVQLQISPSELLGYVEPSASDGQQMYAPVFGSFGIFERVYPEEALRSYLRAQHVSMTLRCAQTEFNPCTTEDCIRWAQEIVKPTQNATVKGGENDLKGIERELHNRMEAVDSELREMRRQDWTEYIAKDLEVYYQSKAFRMGAEFYFTQLEAQSDEISTIRAHELEERFDRVLCDHALPISEWRTLLRAVVNELQQKVLEHTQRQSDDRNAMTQREETLKELGQTWLDSSLFDRWRGKDMRTLERYKAVAAAQCLDRIRQLSLRFTLRVLNEVIVKVSAIDERCVHIRQLTDEMQQVLQEQLATSNPQQQLRPFDANLLSRTLAQMEQDHSIQMEDYRRCLPLIMARATAGDGSLLLSAVTQDLEQHTDAYLDEGIRSGRLPEILNLPIVNRIRKRYEHLEQFTAKAKEEAAFTIALREGVQKNDRYLWLSAEELEASVDKTWIIKDAARIGLLHSVGGLALTDLDGFAGQRLTFEPTMF
jgi:hypothetical protein